MKRVGGGGEGLKGGRDASRAVWRANFRFSDKADEFTFVPDFVYLDATLLLSLIQSSRFYRRRLPFSSQREARG